MPNTQSVIIADTNFLSMQGLQSIVSAHADLDLLKSISDSEELKSESSHYPDIFIVNLSQHSELFTQKALDWKRKSKVLAIADLKNEIHIQKLWQNGIDSIVTNQCSEEEIHKALNHITQQEKFFCNTILDLLSKGSKNAQLEELSTRELQVLELIVKGKSSKEISEELFLSHHTVNSHRKNILKKLNLKSPAELIIYALDHGFSQ